jgi:tetratricopeptide (TPR) repeat protein
MRAAFLRSLAGLVVAVFVVATATPAHAADKRAAAAHFQKGRALFDAASYAAALEEFSAGYDAYPLPGFLVNIGQCQRKLDRLDDAAASFQRFLDSDVTDPKLRSEVQDALAEISSERDRRLAADIEARRQRDEAERRHPLDEQPRTPRLAAPESTLPAVAAAMHAQEPVATVTSHPQKSRKWVWAVVGVLAVGVAATAITVGVVESQPQPAHAGSLGLLDGRR